MNALPAPAEHSPVGTPFLRQRLPRWLKRRVPKGNANHVTARLLAELRLETVCDNARCPNRMECYSRRTATFLILGKLCTRGCRFCAVGRGRPEPPDPEEPLRVADAARRLGLRHVVITSVTRDDLPDGGAEHFRQCVLAVRQRTQASVEVLTPDFGDCPGAVERLLEAGPEVFNHNTETVPRLYRTVRGLGADYRRSLGLLARVKRLNPRMRTKSGLMLGLGETREEVLDTLADLRGEGCDLLTIGQYLQPSDQCLPVQRFVPPEEFAEWAQLARSLGFLQVASGPFVRSSYHAGEMAGSG